MTRGKIAQRLKVEAV